MINDSINWVETDNNNVKWVGTQNGLYSFYNNTWTVYNTQNSNIPNNRVDKFKIAYDNTIWFLNNKNGFIKFKNNVFTLYNKSNLPALPTDSLLGLTVDSNDVFFWTDKNGVVKFNSLTNTIYNFDTTNSCLKSIEKLVFHSNHILYGVCKNPSGSSMPPQNKNDSILFANDFTITNTHTPSINYCFYNLFNFCNYRDVFVDRYQNRYEIVSLYTGNQIPDFRLITYDKNNVLISNVSYNQTFDNQIATNTYGRYIINNAAGKDYFSPTIFSSGFQGSYWIGNSIIPNAKIINFDIDILNNVWLATPSGLVGYNDLGINTKVDNISVSDFSIYPNPTSGKLKLTSQNLKEKESCMIKITDMLGREVKQLKFEDEIDVTELEKGIYFLSVYKSKTLIGTKKIVRE
jgi:hypothetical protein